MTTRSAHPGSRRRALRRGNRLYSNRCIRSKERAMKKLRSRSFRPNIECLEDRRVPTTFLVNTFADEVRGNDRVLSLREAIKAANLNPGPDTIVLQAGTYQITRLGADDNNNFGDFDISLNSTADQTDSLTIVGQGGATAILGDSRSPLAGRDRLFEVFGQGNVQFLDL